MLKIKSLTMKNFLSIGNVTQSINFTGNDLVLVLGENLDLGGNDSRNGVGKSAIVNALSYGFFGSSLTNIRKDNLINATNMKHMLVTITFELNGVNYTIERGRKPGIFKFIKDGVDTDTGDDEALGENKHTQMEIENIIGISHSMFKHILALNTYVEPFLALGSGAQREIIEQLLGITKLSEKAEVLSNEVKLTKDKIKEEEFRITAAVEANRRIQVNIESLEKKSKAWDANKRNKLQSITNSITELRNVDVDSEINLHKSKRDVTDLTSEFRSLTKELTGYEKDIADINKTLVRLDKVLASSTEKICPTCNQEMDKDTHDRVHNEYVLQRDETHNQLLGKIAKKDEVKTLVESVSSLIPALPDTFYNTIDEAYNHKSTLETLEHSLVIESETVNPFTDQIETLSKDGLQEIDYDKLNELVKLRDHQDFLMKLLTSNDSFIRKKIIDQNLTFLNFRLAQYLASMGLPHAVKFKSDLEVEISMYGKEFDFDNLSRGERTRLILSLSWAFRDVFEGMNNKINLLFIDELIDSGLDSSGVEAALAVLKKMSREHDRNIYIISHRDELIGRVSNVLKVVKEGGFTNIEIADNVI